MGMKEKLVKGLLLAVLPVLAVACDQVEETTVIPAGEDISGEEPLEEPAADPTAETSGLLPLTPPQGEGPYYPLEKPADRDADLTLVTGRERQAEGQILLLEGRILLEDGTPVTGARVEIWQTDSNGVYLHPNDPNFAERDQNFQSYGESMTGPDGRYSFITLYPQLYGSRPRHIHAKVIVDEQVLLTTQFYFDGDERLQSDGLVAQAGDDLERLLVDLQETVGPDGERMLAGQLDIILPQGALPTR